MKKKFPVLCVGVTLLGVVFADTLSLDGSDCVINVDSGTKSITSIIGTKSKIVKTGGGVLELAVKSDLISAIDVQGGTLRFLNNDFVLGDPGSTDLPDVVVSGTGTALVARRPVVFGNLTLGAGTTMSQEALITDFAADNTTAVLRPAEEPANFPAFSVNGKLTVTGNATVSCPLALSTAGTTEFAVSDGATLTVAELRVGHAADGSARPGNGFVKTGAGTLYLSGAAGVGGTVDCRAGVIRLGQNARFAEAANVVTAIGAKILLDDGAVLPVDGNAEIAGLLASAEVWFDATRISAAKSAAVPSVPNLGTAGGAFCLFSAADAPDAPKFPGAPTYAETAINGLPALHFDGNQALGLKSYTNRTAEVSVYYVARITYATWYRSPFSLCTVAATTDDRATSGALHVQVNDSLTKTQLIGVSGYQEIVLENDNRSGINIPYMDCIRKGPTGMSLLEYVGEDKPDAAVTNKSGVTSFNGLMNVDVTCLGGRLGTNGVPIYCYADSRLYIGDIGEFLVFSRRLSDDEERLVGAYLKNKWFGTTKAGWTTEKSAALNVEVSEGAAATVRGALAAVPGGDALVKTGEGTLSAQVRTQPGARLSAAAGTLAVDACALLSRADIWADAGDLSTFTFDTDNKTVVAWRNKGRSGGSFHQTGAQFENKDLVTSGSTPLPTYAATGLGGKRPAVVFNKNSALVLDTYENKRASRSLSVYVVLQYNSSYQGWGAPFSFSNVDSTQNDNNTAGSFHVPDADLNTVYYYIGTSKWPSSGFASPVTRTNPYIFVSRQDAFGGVFSFEGAVTDVLQVPTYARARSDATKIDRVLVGGRLGPGGNAQFQSSGSSNNRLWNGWMSEFIVFTDPLGHAEEQALLAYLRAKWLDKGTASIQAPAFLSGRGQSLDYGLGELTVGEGTTVRKDGPSVTVGVLSSGSGVTWQFPTAGTQGFVVSEPMSFGANQTIRLGWDPVEPYLAFAGTAASWSAASWQVRPTDDVTFVSPCKASCRQETGVFVKRQRGLTVVVR